MQNPLGTVGQNQRPPGNRLPGDGGDRETSRKPRIRVFVVMENRLLRDVVARLLCRQGEIELCGKGGRATPSEELAKSGCEVELLDFVDAEWMSAVRERGREAGRAIKTVVIGMDTECEAFLESVRNGVTGYLLKDASAADVVVALRAAARGEATRPPEMCVALFQIVAQAEGDKHSRRSKGKTGLTPWRQKLTKLVGLTSHKTAEELRSGEYPVNHSSRIRNPRNGGNPTKAIRAARAVGLARSP